LERGGCLLSLKEGARCETGGVIFEKDRELNELRVSRTKKTKPGCESEEEADVSQPLQNTETLKKSVFIVF
jgi:hypothetical protein